MRRDYKDDDLVALAMKPPLDFAPGTKWSYSNTGYVLLGTIITKVSGKFYGDFLAERIFTPLGMTTTRVINEADIQEPLRGLPAGGSELTTWNGFRPRSTPPPTAALPDGARPREVDAASTRTAAQTGASQMWTPVRLANGATFNTAWLGLDEQRGRRLFEHGGSAGFSTATHGTSSGS
jgi:CubicO group peptidase (beta-lactamase class C family)